MTDMADLITQQTMKTDKNTAGLITGEEKELALHCMEAALKSGADQARISLSKSVLDTYGMMNGVLDKVAHSADRSVYLYVFADRKYGTFSTNMLDRAGLEDFAGKAVAAVKLLAEDVFRKLPDPERQEKNACDGRELGLYDVRYQDISPEERSAIAAAECIYGKTEANGKFRLISEECEYSDSVDDNFLADSQGFRGRHTETSFAVCSEITIEDASGKKYSGYWWESSPFLDRLERGRCSAEALDRAVRQIGGKRGKSRTCPMVVDRSVSSRLVAPLFSALNSASIQQENSFLKDTLGKKIFSDRLTLTDLARTPGKPGSRLYDTEGVATGNMDIIRNGVVETCFTSTYMALKTGLPPTVEGVSRPVLQPCCKEEDCCPHGSFGAREIIRRCGSGIYVTGFNGGNCNPTTGNFSYGIEGFAFRNGKITHPLKEMIITGNMTKLWNSLAYAGNDPRESTRWQIPTLCFENVDFSG